MAKTSTERQQEYLARRRSGVVDEQRVYAWLPVTTAARLDSLAKRDGTSRRAVLIRLIDGADDAGS